MSKLGIRHVVAAHVRTLKNYGSGRYRPADFLTFYGLPALFALLTPIYAGAPDEAFGTCLVLFAGLTAVAVLLTLVLVFQLSSAAQSNATTWGPFHEVGERLLAETNANAAYALAVTLLLAAAGLAYNTFFAGATPSAPKTAASFACAYVAAHLLLTLLMVVRRVNVLMAQYIKAD
jgi:hypothetical protein